ncbi:hypothetical protein L1887_25964 [Cichorium endivia]|nr:hypothetical protein L1887_25964 [Cichorium endivia]
MKSNVKLLTSLVICIGFILDDHIGNRGRKVYVVSFDRGKLWDESIDGVFKLRISTLNLALALDLDFFFGHVDVSIS